MRQLIPKRTLSYLLLAGCIGLAGAACAAGFKLQLLHASDLEGGVDAIADAPNFGAVIEALERDAREMGGIASILLSAGDNYIPGPFFSASDSSSMRGVLAAANREIFNEPGLTDIREGSGRVDITIMNILGFDASALGNHEFDPGTRVLREIIAPDIRGPTLGDVRWLGARFPYLSANLDFSGDGNLNDLFTRRVLANIDFQPSTSDLSATDAAPGIARAATIRVDSERGPELIGVVGATTPMLSTISFPGSTRVIRPGGGGDDMAALAAVLQPVIDDVIDGADHVRSTADDVDKMVLLTHLQQISRERALAGLLGGVDIIVAGGSDTLLVDDDDTLRPGDVAGGPYPIAATNRDGDPTLIVSTGGQYKYVGRLLLEFDEHGRAVVVPGPDQAAVNGAYATDDSGRGPALGQSNRPIRVRYQRRTIEGADGCGQPGRRGQGL